MKLKSFFKSLLLSLPFFGASSAGAAIYHITTRTDWQQALQKGYLTYESLQTEGFIHCSGVDQVLRPANQYYKGKRDVILLKISPSRLRSPLRYDFVPTHDEYYPHIYGPINTNAVVKIYPLPVGPDGLFRLPPDIAR